MINLLAVTLLHLASLDSLAAGFVAFAAALDLLRGSGLIAVFFFKISWFGHCCPLDEMYGIFSWLPPLR